jgi:hypothetical protein
MRFLKGKEGSLLLGLSRLPVACDQRPGATGLWSDQDRAPTTRAVIRIKTMPKTPQDVQEDKASAATEAAKGSAPRPQPRWKDEAKADDDEDELFNDLPV